MSFRYLHKQVGFNSNAAIDLATEWVVSKTQQTLEYKNKVSWALSGGKTPAPVYQNLANRQDIAWDQLKVFLVDERDFDINHSDSNARLCLESGLNQKLSAEQFILMRDQALSSISAQMYEDILFHHHEDQGHDVVILGLGSDGHTGSLFPQTLAGTAHDPKHLVVCHRVPTLNNQWRISLSFEALLRAKHLLFFVLGADKAGIVRDIFEHQNSDFPATKLCLLREKYSKATDLIIDNAANHSIT